MSNLKYAAWRTNAKIAQLNKQIWKSWTVLCTVTFSGNGSYTQKIKKPHKKEANMKWKPGGANTHQVPQVIPSRYSVHVCTHTPQSTFDI